MKIYLDDERKAPEGWIQCRWPEEVIELLKTNKVTDISLDHDLGDIGKEKERTGYDVLLWLEEMVATYVNFLPPNITIHTANPVARKRMEASVRFIMGESEE